MAADAAPLTVRTGNTANTRDAWIDVARGICIILVVMMHSALGVEKATGQVGWVHALVAWSKPFRMPDFFFLSGLLAAGVPAMANRRFLDRKIVHFVYFYVLWLLIITILRGTTDVSAGPTGMIPDFLFGLVEPFGTLWFIYVLPLFFIVLRFVARQWIGAAVISAAVLHIAAASFPDGGQYAMSSKITFSTAFDSFALFLVFFLLGYASKPHLAGFFGSVAEHPLRALVGLAAWAIIHTLALSSGMSAVPGVTVVFGVAGAMAIAVCAILLSSGPVARTLAYFGANSLTIYLSFVIPMGAARAIILKSSIIVDAGWQAFWVTLAAISLPLLFGRLISGTVLDFLFRRPAWAHLAGAGPRP